MLAGPPPATARPNDLRASWTSDGRMAGGSPQQEGCRRKAEPKLLCPESLLRCLADSHACPHLELADTTLSILATHSRLQIVSKQVRLLRSTPPCTASAQAPPVTQLLHRPPMLPRARVTPAPRRSIRFVASSVRIAFPSRSTSRRSDRSDERSNRTRRGRRKRSGRSGDRTRSTVDIVRGIPTSSTHA